jgi:hypothetical protein
MKTILEFLKNYNKDILNPDINSIKYLISAIVKFFFAAFGLYTIIGLFSVNSLPAQLGACILTICGLTSISGLILVMISYFTK